MRLGASWRAFTTVTCCLLFYTSSAAGATPVRVMPLGDSITWGADTKSCGFYIDGGYRLPLWDMLQPTYAFDFVGSYTAAQLPQPCGIQEPPVGFDTAQEGHPGYTAGMILGSMDGWLAQSQPQVILLMIGINDLSHGETPAQTLQYIDALYQKLLAYPSVTQVLASSLLPNYVGGGNATSNNILAVNAGIVQLVAKYRSQGLPITFVDQYNLSGITAADLSDGVHPNDSGYVKMAKLWAQALRSSGALPKKAVPQVRGDVNGDGFSDLIWQYQGTQLYIGYEQHGLNVVGATNIPSPPANTVIEGTADFNGDGQADRVIRDQTTGAVTINYMNQGQIAGSLALPAVTDLNWHIAGIADFDGDGLVDLLWYNGANGGVALWYMNGPNLIRIQLLSGNVPASSGWQLAGAGDLNGDGLADIVWRHSSGVNVAWQMRADASYAFLNLPTVADPNWQIGAVADFNGDGLADLVWYHAPSRITQFWYMNGATMIGGGQGPSFAPGWRMVGPR